MHVLRDTVGNVTLLRPRGKITIGVGDVAIREAVQEVVREGKTRIVLDLSGVSTLDSSGVGELVAAFTTVTNHGGKLTLLNPSMKVSDVLQITQLASAFSIFDDETEAVAYLAD